MKIKLFILACMMMFTGSAFAQQKSLNVQQQNLRSSIMSFLRDEGYQPSIDDDGDIKFKRQGDIYYVIVSENDESPMYIRLAKYFEYGTKMTKQKVRESCEEINKYKMLKLSPLNNSFCMDIVLYVTNSQAFTAIFNKVIKIMEDAEEELYGN